MNRDWNQASLSELAAHIVATHHVYCREQVPNLQSLLREAALEAGGPDAELTSLQTSFQRLASALLNHLMKEESVLFPLIERIECARREGVPPPASSFGSVGNPIRMMVLEHSEAEAVLRQMREATQGFQPSEGARPRRQELYRSLRDFDSDMARHVELEDKFLFPRAIALEQETLAS